MATPLDGATRSPLAELASRALALSCRAAWDRSLSPDSERRDWLSTVTGRLHSMPD